MAELGNEATAAMLLTWLEWVEVRGFEDFEEWLLRGVVMTAGAARGC